MQMCKCAKKSKQLKCINTMIPSSSLYPDATDRSNTVSKYSSNWYK
jgi:hypothetical protein